MSNFLDKIICLNLGIKSFSIQATAINLKTIINVLLEHYEINETQIISITIDNGRNMIKAAHSFETNRGDGTLEIQLLIEDESREDTQNHKEFYT